MSARSSPPRPSAASSTTSRRCGARPRRCMRLPLPEARRTAPSSRRRSSRSASIAELKREVFGPVLHVLRFRRDRLDALIDDINATGYGLTFGVHTRIDETIAHVTERVAAGNIYVNRNIIGAVVGVQPFGGHGLSGHRARRPAARSTFGGCCPPARRSRSCPSACRAAATSPRRLVRLAEGTRACGFGRAMRRLSPDGPASDCGWTFPARWARLTATPSAPGVGCSACRRPGSVCSRSSARCSPPAMPRGFRWPPRFGPA